MKNAICKKEMQRSIRKKKNAIGMLIFNLMLIAGALFGFYMLLNQYTTFTYRNYSEMSSLSTVIMAVEMFLVLFIVPALTAATISGEREKQTLDILFTTSMSSWEIVWGKLVSSISTLVLYIISGVPVLFIIFSVGGLKVWDVLVCLFYILVVAIYIGSIGIFFSALLKRSVAATVCTYGTVIFLTVGTYFLIHVAAMLDAESMNLPMNGILALALLNPFASITNLISSQCANGCSILEDLLYRNEEWLWKVNSQIENRGLSWSDFWYQNVGEFWNKQVGHQLWFVLAIVVQLVMSVILLNVAAKRLKIKARER